MEVMVGIGTRGTEWALLQSFAVKTNKAIHLLLYYIYSNERFIT